MWSDSQRHCLTLMGFELLGTSANSSTVLERTSHSGIILVYDKAQAVKNAPVLVDLALYLGEMVESLSLAALPASDYSRESVVIMDESTVEERLKQQGYKQLFSIKDLMQSTTSKRLLWDLVKQMKDGLK